MFLSKPTPIFPKVNATPYNFHHTVATGFPRLLPPIRKIGLGRRALAGMIPTDKQGEPAVARFESSLERDFYVLLEFDPYVTRWDPQPLRLQVAPGLPSYVPDALVSYVPSNGDAHAEYRVLYEIKYREELKNQWATLKPRFMAARRYARSQGWRFKLITEREIRGTDLLWNAKFLLPYVHDSVSEGEHALLTKMLRRLEQATPSTLLSACATDPWEQARLLNALWHLVAIRDIGCDLGLKLTMHSEIWLRD